VAFVSDEGKRSGVYVQGFPVAGAARPVSTAGGTQPRWSPNGTELFYIAPDANLMAVQVKTGGGFESGVPVPLFDTGLRNVRPGSAFSYAVSRDGRRFLLQTPIQDSTGAAPIKIVTNWLAGVKK
jgi:hypothetical protein